MHYLQTAFAQLHFVWKLYNYALEGNINREELDREITFKSEDGRQIFVLPGRIFESHDDFILAFENNLSITFGAATITLNRSRYEAGHDLPNPIESENEQCIAFVYQLRCAFAHDISEPNWKIKGRFKRKYRFGGMEFDLTNLDGERFAYCHIVGPEYLGFVKDFAVEHLLHSGKVR